MSTLSSASSSSFPSDNGSVASSAESNGEKYLPFEKSKHFATEIIENKWPQFTFGPRMNDMLFQALSVGKIDETTTLHLIFKFNMLFAESRYLASY